MKRILFVCHGNICRSPMAEYIMKDLTKNSSDYYIDSAATSYEEIGNGLYYLAKDTLDRHHIPYGHHQARHIRKSDLDEFELIVGMDEENIIDLKYYFNNSSKIHKLLEFVGLDRDVIDPWYSRKFEECFDDLVKGCKGLYEFIERNAKKEG